MEIYWKMDLNNINILRLYIINIKKDINIF